jgi:tRNA/tmRNA/rRNA uracil-C5-methylase (TrmA/RlmC/RlmD family)
MTSTLVKTTVNILVNTGHFQCNEELKKINSSLDEIEKKEKKLFDRKKTINKNDDNRSIEELKIIKEDLIQLQEKKKVFFDRKNTVARKLSSFKAEKTSIVVNKMCV